MSSKDASGNLRWSKLAGRSRRSIIADIMAQALVRPELISLAAGFTDNAVVPDAIVREAKGRLYLAKDARMPRTLLESGYPRLAEFLNYRDPGISSAMSRRLLGV